MTFPRLEVKESSIPYAGLGLYTKEKIQKGKVVTELSGEFLAIDEAIHREDKRYMFQYTKEIILDSKASQCFGKYVNSARGTQFNNNLKWSVDYRNQRVILKATRNIQAGAELFVSYRY